MRACLRVLVGVSALALLSLGLLACDSEQFGTQGVPQLRLSTEAITFQATPVGESGFEELTILSDGDRPLVVEDLRIEPDSSEFFLDTTVDLPLTLDAGFEQTLTLVYRPQTVAANPTADLVIVSNDRKTGEDGVVRVPMSVQAQNPRLTRDTGFLRWGADEPRPTNLGCGELINRKSVQLTNRGSGQLFLLAYQLRGRDLPEGEAATDHFSVCPPESWKQRAIGRDAGSIPQQTWDIVFHPTTDGVKQGSLSIESNGGSITIELEGGGESQSSVDVAPMVLTWPELQMGGQATKPLDIINTGGLPVDVTNVRVMPSSHGLYYTISGATFVANEGQASGRLSQAIPARGTVRLDITYRASEPEPVEAELEIYHSAATPPSPIVVRLLGNVGTPQMNVDPLQVEFTGTPVGTSADRTLVVTNVGSAELVVDRVDIEPDGETLGSENFSCRPAPCSATLQPGDYETFQIRYDRPLEAMQLEDRGCARIVSNDPGQQPPGCVSLLARNSDGNTPPVACPEASPSTTVAVGETVTLSCACSSDADEGQTIERCDWMLVDWPAASHASLTLTAGDLETPTQLVPDAVGSYRVVLVVTDDSATHFLSPEEDIQIVAQ